MNVGKVAWRRITSFAFLLVLLLLLGATLALADEGAEQEPSLPTGPEVREAIEEPSPDPALTNPEAAEELPHEDLSRSEAKALLQGVFEPEMEGPAGIFDELHVEKFLAPNVALIPAGQQPDSSSSEQAGGASTRSYQGPTLMDSTMPLSTEDESGKREAVDLNLEASGRDFQPVNPLVEVEIPAELGEGIELPGPGVKIELEGASEETAPSTLSGSVAFYPNVSEDTDFAVAPDPAGVETMTQVRGPKSPRSQTYKLTLPQGATVQERGDGADVTRGAETLMTIAAPTAMDATGNPIPAELKVEGDDVTITVSTNFATNYPVLVDPLFQAYEWYAKHIDPASGYDIEGWERKSPENPWGGVIAFGNAASSRMGLGSLTYGLDTEARTSVVANGEAFWVYPVPRYYSDFTRRGARPETFIAHMTATDVDWRAESESLSPYMYIGLWGPSAGWASLYTHEGLAGHGLNNLSYVYQLPNELGVPDVQIAMLGMYSGEAVKNGSAELYVGGTTLELAEPASTVPHFGLLTGPAEWLTKGPVYLNFRATDAGLGVRSVTAAGETGSTPPSWTTAYGCTGVAGSSCPYEWSSKLGIEPESLPTGADVLKVTAEDPLGHTTVNHVEVDVDHTNPYISLSGSMAEQAKLGTARPAYSLHVIASDGNAQVPQSGVSKLTIKMDGQVVYESSPGCSTQNCMITQDWSLEASKYAPGVHVVEVDATDAVGHTSISTLPFELHPSAPPTLQLSGTVTEQSALGVTRPSYALKVLASAQAQAELKSSKAPNLQSTIGSPGAGSGQFKIAGGVAYTPKGQLWVADPSAGRVEEFNVAGEYLRQFGSPGSKPGQLSEAGTLAVDASGNVWVADTGNNRLEEFSETGEFLKEVGERGTGLRQMISPEGVAVSPKNGYIIVGDRGNSRLDQYRPQSNNFVTLGKKGSEPGQLSEPVGVAVDAKNEIWVADYGNNRIMELNEAGGFIRQVGNPASTQFAHPVAITIDPAGHVWVGDSGHDSVQEFNETGEYMTKFGSPGAGRGQFNMARPMGIASDGLGNLWISDSANSRVERWAISIPSYGSSIGTSGSGNGQFKAPAGVASTPKGQLWVADPQTARIEEFSASGEYLRQVGSKPSGPLSEAGAIAVDAAGDVWVTETGSSRVDEFSETGQPLLSFKGSASGQLVSPEGIAVDTNGNLWICNRGNGGIVKFSSKGQFLEQAITGLGEPTSIAIDTKGDLWITEYGTSRVAEYSAGGTLIRQVGSQGSGLGQFLHPAAIAVDASGHVWVGDSGNNRIEELSETGTYLSQFGTKGSGPGQFMLTRPMGITADGLGNVWVSDPTNSRVQKWIASPSPTLVATEISVDGKNVDSAEAGCLDEVCTLGREWTLESSSYPVGPHTISVTATDGTGRTTTKTVATEIQRDSQKPELQASGSLLEAPDGWVQQQTYEVAAVAKDGGAGVTELKLLLDGHSVANASQLCPNGGCALTHPFSVNTAEYPGGAHEAELIAVDGAGNTTSKRWTINIDPEGKATVAEVEDTLDAADETAESTVTAPTSEVLPPEQIQGGDNPGLKVTGSLIESTGVPDKTTMTQNPQEGFTIHSPGGETKVTPIVAEGSSQTSVAESVAGVTANTSHEADTVIRPDFNGLESFQEIRSDSSPETYSYNVHLGAKQKLRLANSAQAEVVYESGLVSFLITAEPAHDATGKPVPTTLSVEGNILTLHVNFKSKVFTYPIVAGQGWETSYTVPVIVQGPEDETQIREREEREARELAEQEATGTVPPPPNPITSEQAERVVKSLMGSGGVIAAPPLPVCKGTCATASATRTFVVESREVCSVTGCGVWHVILAAGVESERPHFVRGYDYSEWVNGTPFHNYNYYNAGYAAVGLSVTEEGHDFIGPWKVVKQQDKHLTIWGRFHISQPFGSDLYTGTKDNYLAIQNWVWPNGYQERIVKHYEPPYSES